MLGKVPTTARIDLGELAINTRNGKLFLKRDNGNATFSIIEVGLRQVVASNPGLGAFTTMVSRGCAWILTGILPLLATSPYPEHLDHGVSSIWGTGAF